MEFIKELRKFTMNGSVFDRAVHVMMAEAFGAIISSLVDDVITPLLLKPALEAANAEDLDKLTWGAVKYGKFLAAIIKFVIVALVLFLIIKGINSMKEKKKAVEPPPEMTMSEKLLVEIRDGLKNKNT